MLQRNKLHLITILLFAFFNLNHTAFADAVYAQLVSNADQLATMDTLDKGIPISLQIVDDISGMQWDPTNNRLLIQTDGVYFIMSDVQVGARESATNIVKGGDVYYWLDQNGSPIKDTGNWVFVSPESRSKTIYNVWIMPLKAGDALRFMFSSSAPSMGLITIPPEKKRPNSPGLTLTVFKVESENTVVSTGKK